MRNFYLFNSHMHSRTYACVCVIYVHKCRGVRKGGGKGAEAHPIASIICIFIIFHIIDTIIDYSGRKQGVPIHNSYYKYTKFVSKQFYLKSLSTSSIIDCDGALLWTSFPDVYSWAAVYPTVPNRIIIHCYNCSLSYFVFFIFRMNIVIGSYYYFMFSVTYLLHVFSFSHFLFLIAQIRCVRSTL